MEKKDFKEKVKIWFKYLYNNIKRPEMKVLPGHLAFYLMMMLVPLLTLIGSLLSSFKIVTSSISDVLYDNLPENIANLIIFIVEQKDTTTSIWILLIPTLILASNGTYSMIITSNSIYKLKTKNYLLNRIKAFLMMIVLISIFLFLLLVPTFGNIIFRIIGSLFINPDITNDISYILFNILKYPFTFLVVFLAVKALYIMAPNKKVQKEHVNYGAIFTSIMWVISTWIYSYYIEYFSSYETFYGSISSLLFLMLWLFVISYIFVLGMALNASRYEFDNELKEIEKDKQT